MIIARRPLFLGRPFCISSYWVLVRNKQVNVTVKFLSTNLREFMSACKSELCGYLSFLVDLNVPLSRPQTSSFHYDSNFSSDYQGIFNIVQENK